MKVIFLGVLLASVLFTVLAYGEDKIDIKIQDENKKSESGSKPKLTTK